MPTPLTDADKVLRNDTGKDIVEKLDDIAQALGVGVNADQINYDNTESGLEADDVQNAIDEVNDKVVNTKTITNVPIASFNDGAKAFVKSLTTLITPIQAGTGTPSPQNVRAISGHSSVNVVRCGRNLLKNDLQSQTYNGVIYTVNADGSITLGGRATSETIRFFLFDLQAGSYIYTSDITEDFTTYDTYITKSGTTIARGREGSNTFTLTELSRLVFGIRVRSGISPNVTVKPMIRLSSDTLTTFEAYQGETTTIPLGQTVYSGSLECVEGEGEITYGYIEFDGSSDEDWSYATGNKWATITISDMKSGANQDGITNWLPKATSYGIFGFALGRNNNNFYAYQIPDISGVTDLASWKTYLSNNPLQVVYPLSTPTSLPVSGANIETLSGQNNLYSSSGDIEELTYFTKSSDKTEELIRATSYTKDETNNLISSSLDISTEIITLAPIQTFSDGGDNIPLKSLVTEILPIQSGSGVPSPSNVRAISGHSSVNVVVTGKNILDVSIANRNYTSPYTFFRFGGSSADPVDGSLYLAKGTYTFSISTTAYVIRALDKDNQSIEYVNNDNKLTFTLTESQKCMITMAVSGDVQVSDFTYQLELNDEATTYEAYKGSNTTIPLGSTIYGGSLECVEGSGYSDGVLIDLANYTGRVRGVGENENKYFRFEELADSPDLTKRTLLLCDKFPLVEMSVNNTNIGVDIIEPSTLGYTVIAFRPPNVTQYTTQTVLDYIQQTLGSLQVCYRKATPTSLSVSGANIPTISGLNNIYTDCGDILSLEYFNNKTDELANLIHLMTRT